MTNRLASLQSTNQSSIYNVLGTSYLLLPVLALFPSWMTSSLL